MLFDFDGTLADSLPLIAASFVHALGTEGFTITVEDVYAVAGAPFRGMISRLAGETSPEQFERLANAYGAAYRSQADMLQPITNAVALLDALAAQQILLAVITNRIAISVATALTTLGWSDRFAVVLGSDETANPKPAPDPALLALERLGIEPGAAAYVGDHETDVLCAVATGIPLVIGLALNGHGAAMRNAGATHVVAGLDEVAALLLPHSAAVRP